MLDLVSILSILALCGLADLYIRGCDRLKGLRA